MPLSPDNKAIFTDVRDGKSVSRDAFEKACAAANVKHGGRNGSRVFRFNSLHAKISAHSDTVTIDGNENLKNLVSAVLECDQQ